MYFWRIESLKSELRQGPLAQRSAFAYILATMLLYSILSGMPGLWNAEPESPSVINWLGFVLAMLVIPVGTYAAFAANGGRTGVDFASRYIAISWVLLLRLVVLLFVPLLIGVFLLIDWLNAVPTDPEIEVIAVVSSLIVEVAFYWLLRRHLAEVSKASCESTSHESGSG